MKGIGDIFMDAGVFCPEHGTNYDMDCEKCHEVTRDYMVKNGLYIVFMKFLQMSLEPKPEPWDSDSFLFYMRNEKAVHEGELEKARKEGDREKELRETGYLQALGFVIDELKTE